MGAGTVCRTRLQPQDWPLATQRTAAACALVETLKQAQTRGIVDIATNPVYFAGRGSRTLKQETSSL
jgi:hypothetical protein